MSKKRDIKITYTNPDNSEKRIRRIIFSILFSCLFIMEILVPLNYVALGGVCAILAIAISVGLHLILPKKKPAIIMLCGIAVIYGVMIIAFSDELINGGTLILNQLISKWNEANASIYYLYVTNNTNIDTCLYMFVIMLMGLITIIVNLLVYYKLYSPVVAINYLVFGLYIMILNGKSLIMIGLMLIIVLTFIVLIDTDTRMLHKSKGYLIVVTLGVVLASVGMYFIIKIIPQENIQAIQKKIVLDIEHSIYGEVDLTDGDLVGIEDRDTSDTVRLQVKTDYDDAIYLKGFVGSRYTGDAWIDLDGEAYADDNKDMHQWLIDNKYSPVNMLTRFITISDAFRPGTHDVVVAEYTVENVSASSKYIYIPYTLQNRDFDYYNNMNKDMNVRNALYDIKDTYSYSTLEIGFQQYEDLYNNGCLTDKEVIEINERYLVAEQSYREYVDKYYLDVPEELNSYFAANLPTSERGAYEITNTIRTYLDEHLAYTDSPRYSFDGNGDFIIDLLSNKKEGYSVHYASAGVMMFRYYGIPARYVEGYRRAGDMMAETEFSVNDAHAWVEIYRYGMGWVPIDVTPGYYLEVDNEMEYVSEPDAITPEIPPISESSSAGDDTSNVSNNPPPPVENEAEDDTYDVYFYLWIILILLLLIILIILIRRKIILHMRNKRINSDDIYDSVLYMAGLIWKLVNKYGIKVENTNPDLCEEKMDDVFNKETKLKFSKLTSILKRIRYSNNEYNEDDFVLVKAYMTTVKEHVYKDSNTLKRFKLKYLDVLC